MFAPWNVVSTLYLESDTININADRNQRMVSSPKTPSQDLYIQSRRTKQLIVVFVELLCGVAFNESIGHPHTMHSIARCLIKRCLRLFTTVTIVVG